MNAYCFSPHRSVSATITILAVPTSPILSASPAVPAILAESAGFTAVVEEMGQVTGPVMTLLLMSIKLIVIPKQTYLAFGISGVHKLVISLGLLHICANTIRISTSATVGPVTRLTLISKLLLRVLFSAILGSSVT